MRDKGWTLAATVVFAAWAATHPSAQGGSPASLDTAPVTFTKHIAPIVFARCASCHRPGGGAPFNLLTYDDVRPRATQIAALTAARVMPPWKPEPGFGDFAGARRLDESEIAAIRRWVEQGAVRGEPADMPSAPAWPGDWQLGTPDLVVTMPEAYVLPNGGADVFRSFVIRVPLARGRYVRGLEFRPGNPHAVHHANLKIDRTASSRRLDDSDALPGFDGGAGRDARFPDGYFLGWTPGQQSRLADEGLWRLDPGTDIVVELHMMPTDHAETVQASVGLFLTDTPPSRRPYVLRLGRQNIDIPAGEPAHVVTDEYVLPVAVDVLSVQPHAHNLAREIKSWAELPDGSTRPLIWIAQWDFRWQDVYRYVDPVALPSGTVLRMRYTYDNSGGNSRNPHRPPRRVTFGQTTSSEMGDLWIQVVTRGGGDRAALDRDFVPKMLREDIAGVEKMLETTPDDPKLHADLAFCYIADGRLADAIAHLDAARRLEPRSANAHYELGTALLQARRLDEAADRFTEAVRLAPMFSEAHNNLGAVRFLQGRTELAIRSYEEALRHGSNNAEAHYNLGRALAARRDAPEAIRHYRRALEIRPDDAGIHASLGSALVAIGTVGEAIREYRRALEIRPDFVVALTDLAWILAGSEQALRDPPEALRLAERAARLTDSRNATVLDTLALAYFSAGQLERAVDVQRAAVDLASVSETEEMTRRLRERLAFYVAQPGRPTPAGQPPPEPPRPATPGPTN
jgi:tetratricopeptide (TPR) repeat protein/mono/diheme cytochrome c family protein